MLFPHRQIANKVEQLENEKGVLEQKIQDEQDARKRDAETQLDNQRREFDRERHDLAEKNKTKEKETSSLKSRVRDLSEECQRLQDRLAQAEHDRGKLYDAFSVTHELCNLSPYELCNFLRANMQNDGLLCANMQ